MRKVHITQPRFMPNVAYLQKIFASDIVIFSDDLKINKRVYEHRNEYQNCKKTLEGFVWLKHSKVKHKDYKIDAPDLGHSLNLLYDSYKGCPHYKDFPVWELFKYNCTITDWTMVLVELIADLLGIPPPIMIKVSDLKIDDETGSDRILRILNEIKLRYGGLIYLAGAESRQYLKDVGDMPVMYHFHTVPVRFLFLDTLYRIGKEEFRELVMNPKFERREQYEEG